MRPLWKTFLAALVVVPAALHGQEFSSRSSLMFRGTIVTSSRVFDNPDAPVGEDRDHFDFVDNLLGGGLEYRLIFPQQDLFLSLSVEYLARITSSAQSVLVNNVVQQLPIEQGVRFIPVELGVNTSVPIIGDDGTLVMGGGFGAYYADRVFGIAGVRMKSKNLPVGYGLHIESGFEYRISERVALSWEMRFRDPEVINESEFGTSVINVGSYQVSVDNIPPKTKVNVHGVSFTLGVVLALGSS